MRRNVGISRPLSTTKRVGCMPCWAANLTIMGRDFLQYEA